ncbi:nucleoside phosphatase family-domain-containing protein [Lasiosphaeria miniovina]|uniref:Nucleoside phosphatase family-domain-containing protein n=1 Tax=Lasiosphaeria miniovina TaxID=1954250 RepID=A0AA40AUI7_9PEZI|nr:nucleoside phosphatase family-domain-containing protein [Lasiosphaeria miniovina]KAK0722278.1 nucleoside phosphatase family-domain-containing protein [Lasiosphaeria miniovina]
MPSRGRWGVILDAGSSGTRLHIYRWKDPEKALKNASKKEHGSLPRLVTEKKWTKKIRPGVSEFGDKPSRVGPEHLQSLIDHALKIIPEDKIKDTPIFLMATAGMRLLPDSTQASLTNQICRYFQENTDFSLLDCGLHIQVIPGETEGLYGWIASNYLLGGFDKPDSHQHGKGHHTYGFLDMGGASAQIAFAPNSTEAEKHSNDLKLLRMRTIDGSASEYKVFTATWLGFGVNQARESYVQSLRELYTPSAENELPDPCMPKGLRTTLDGDQVGGHRTDVLTLLGTGAFDECLKLTHPLLGKDKPCRDQPCLLNGQHVPAIDFDVNHFIGVSEYWHTTHGVFGGEGDKAYDFKTYQQRVKDFCSRDWDSIVPKLDTRKKVDAKIAQEACFKASWLINVLHDGIGIPRIGIEKLPAANVSKGALEHAKQQGFLDPFQPVDKIGDIEVSWTLGKMVLYAAGQIPPKSGDDRYPVGFGSNAAETIPSDFQFAGSSWHPHGHVNETHDGDDDWDLEAEDLLDKAKSRSASGLLIFFLLFVVLLYFFRTRERRMRLYGKVNALFFHRPRRPGSPRKGGGGRGLSIITNKLFRRPSAMYERVMEEGDADHFELGDVDSSSSSDGGDNDHSDSSEGSGFGRTSGLATPKVNLTEFEPTPSGSALDRSGLVVRTDSRDRLLPSSLQMLHAGKRSRAGSPTRQKSPLISPLQQD